jgi:lipoprotein-anchoring transpeptidase ErfK/SrfK
MTAFIVLFCVGCGFTNDNNVNSKNEKNETRVSDTVPNDNNENKSEILTKDLNNKNESERAVIGEDITVSKEGVVPKTDVVSKKNNITIVIDKSDYTLDVLKDGQVIKEYPVAVGKNPGQKQKSGDLKTPTGSFVVDEVINAKSWTHDFHDGKGIINGAYGPWFISLNTGCWYGIGIHGTHDDSSIGKMVSEGCVRMHNKDVAELKKIVDVGTKVLIKE